MFSCTGLVPLALAMNVGFFKPRNVLDAGFWASEVSEVLRSELLDLAIPELVLLIPPPILDWPAPIFDFDVEVAVGVNFEAGLVRTLAPLKVLRLPR